MADLSLRLLVQGAREASRQVRQFRDETDGIGGAMDRVGRAGKGFTGFIEGGLKNGLKGIGVGAAVAGAAVLGIGAAFTSIVNTSLKSLARIEQINAQTENAIKSTGAAAGVTAQHVEDLTGTLENQTATEAESIQQGANLVLTFTNIKNGVGDGNDIFDQTIKTMTDMNRAMDTTGGAVLDTTGTAIQLGKALNDPVKGITALSKVGVSFSAEQKAMIKTMVANNDTMGAQKVILAELNKEFGGSAEAFAKTSKGQIELAGHAWGTLGEAMSTALLPAVGKVSTVMAATFNYLAEEVAPNLEGVFTKVGDKVTAISYRVADAITYVAGARKSIGDNLDAAISGKGVSGLADNIGEALGLSMDTQLNTVEPILGKIVDKGLQVATVLGSAFATIQTIPISPLNLLSDALGWAATHTEEFKAGLKGVAIAYLVIKGATIAYNVVMGISTGITAANTAALWVNNTAQLISTSYLGTWVGVKALELGAWVRSTAATAVSTGAMALNRAGVIAGAIASGVARGAVLAWTAGQWLLNAALTANPIGLVVAGIALLVGGIVLAYKKSETFRGIVDGLWSGLKSAGGWIKDTLWPIVKDVLIGAFDDAKLKFNAVRDAIGFMVDKLKSAWEWVKKLGDRIADSPIGQGLGAAADVIGKIPGLAVGGPMVAGKTYLTGEQGPELVTPTRSGYVHTADETVGMLQPKPLTLTAPAASPAMFTQQEEKELAALDFSPQFALFIDGKQMTDVVVKEIQRKKARA